VASTARELIAAGKTNEQVWAALQKQFDLPESKKNYPAWYRADCKRKGLI
jgi:plasmid maintenance system antidote protein VapI